MIETVLGTVRATVARHAMLPAGMRVLAAVSGGPDSVALLHVLRELAPRLGFTLAGVAHVNHQLRGAESGEDQRFVAALAAGFGLRFECRAAPVKAEGNLEQNARRARRDFFRELLARGIADRVALGHTRDDQAETVLFRLLRGSGLTGLAGVLPVTADGLVRPLLDVPRSDVRAYLEAHRLAWREDSSNESAAFARNRIRRELLPQLERDWNPHLRVALAQLADVAYEEERLWARRLADPLPGVRAEGGTVELAVRDLAAQPRAEQRRRVRQAIRQVKGDLAGISYRHVEAVIELAQQEGSGRRTAPGVVAERSMDELRLRRPGRPPQLAPLAIEGFGRYPWPPANPLIQLELLPGKRAPGACVTLGVEFPAAGLELRAWRPGDAYQPAGAARVWKLKELFQRARVPSWRRACWPILTGEGKVLWAKQFGPAAGLEGLEIREIVAGG